jgi:hypothetical protein
MSLRYRGISLLRKPIEPSPKYRLKAIQGFAPRGPKCQPLRVDRYCHNGVDFCTAPLRAPHPLRFALSPFFYSAFGQSAHRSLEPPIRDSNPFGRTRLLADAWRQRRQATRCRSIATDPLTLSAARLDARTRSRGGTARIGPQPTSPHYRPPGSHPRQPRSRDGEPEPRVFGAIRSHELILPVPSLTAACHDQACWHKGANRPRESQTA